MNQHIDPKRANALVKEKSPYLLQHAYNPVEWYPWGEEAFDKARDEDKPVFLSIGYSTCHWCHVMERESFENSDIAGILNAHYVSVKVDREERPDVDAVYMSVCQMLTGSGGWPLTLVMTPERVPFFAGTYFPPTRKRGMPGLDDILTEIRQLWDDDREKINEAGGSILEALRNQAEQIAKSPASTRALPDLGFKSLSASFDSEHGGFGSAPKFPTPQHLLFLLRYHRLSGDQEALKMTNKTLDQMARGGIHDHLGGGFCRYSTDERWLAPHFEKMLYDNALLAMAYLEGGQVTADHSFWLTARKTLDWILREMTDPEGGFYSALDADTEGKEGTFYLWTKDEVLKVLGEERGEAFCTAYGVTQTGNFEGKNILNRLDDIGRPDNDWDQERRRLFRTRAQREHPFRDDKILTGWNGLAIAALAMGGRVLGEKRYLDAAQRAAGFVLDRLVDKNGRLLARYREGQARFPAYLDDHQYMIWGLLELYMSTLDVNWLQDAARLMEETIRLFPAGSGGFHLYGSDAEEQLIRPVEPYDGALPSGNAVALLNLWRLRQLEENPLWEDWYGRLESFLAAAIRDIPHAGSMALAVYCLEELGAVTVTLTAHPKQCGDAAAMVLDAYRPHWTVLAEPVKDSQEGFRAQLCDKAGCAVPVESLAEFKKLISSRER